MDLDQVSALQQDIVRSMVDDAPARWDRLEFEMTLVGGYASFAPYAVTGDVREIYDGTYAAGMAGLGLKDAMFEPGRGSWLSFTCAVSPSHSFDFAFNYDEPVSFGIERGPADETWERELTDHPRSWALIPDWCYVKRTFSEVEWDRRRAKLARTRARIRARQSRSDAIRTRLGLPLR